jgi:hypothetical protein
VRSEKHYNPVDFDPPEEVETHVPLTEPQRETCAATLMSDDANCSYNQCFVLKLHGPLSVESLHKALSDVVRRHEALRISIDLIAERQHMLPDAAVAFELPLDHARLAFKTNTASRQVVAIDKMLYRATALARPRVRAAAASRTMRFGVRLQNRASSDQQQNSARLQS